MPASRPRVSRWGTYYGKRYTAWRKAAAQLINPAKHTFTVPVYVKLELVCERPKTSQRLYPRGDVDNYAKAVLDALTEKGYWTDDDLVVRLSVEKRFALKHEAPSIIVTIKPR